MVSVALLVAEFASTKRDEEKDFYLAKGESELRRPKRYAKCTSIQNPSVHASVSFESLGVN